MNNNSKISIITPSFNQGKFIKDTIESVYNQNYKNFEHIIIDGASTDNTLEIINQYKHLKWISEKDKGPVDAITKGFNMASGDIITWLNSDDYFENNIFEEVMNQFITGARVVVGNMILINPDKEVINENKYDEIYNFDYLVRVNCDIIKQPATFFTKEIFNEVGGFDHNLRLVWDYDLFLKMFKLTNPKIINKTIAFQRIYPTTLSRSFSRKQALEIYRVSKRHGAKLTDKISRLILKRYLFPSTLLDNPSLTVKIIQPVVRSIRKMK